MSGVCRHCGRRIVHDATLTLEDGSKWERWTANSGKKPRWWCDAARAAGLPRAVHEPELERS